MPITIQTGSGYGRNRESDLDKIVKGVTALRYAADAGLDVKKLIAGDPDEQLKAEQVKQAQRQNRGVSTVPEFAAKGLKASPLVTGAPQTAPDGSPIASGAPGKSPLTQIPKGAFISRGILPSGEEGDLVVEPIRDPNLALMGREKAFEFRDAQLDKRNENTVHNNIVKGLKIDTALKADLEKYRGLDSALSIITNTDKVTPQQVHEFQQAVRKSLGIGGGSGVGEREATYIDTLGLRADAFRQFLTGTPADIAKDSEVIKHLKNLADEQKDLLRARKDKRINALISGYEHIYGEDAAGSGGSRPDLRHSLNNAIDAISDQFVSSAPSAPAPSAEDFNPAAAARAEIEKRRAARGGK